MEAYVIPEEKTILKLSTYHFISARLLRTSLFDEAHQEGALYQREVVGTFGSLSASSGTNQRPSLKLMLPLCIRDAPVRETGQHVTVL
jgi:hypothetical protein